MRSIPVLLAALLLLAPAPPAAADPYVRHEGAVTEAGVARLTLEGGGEIGGAAFDFARDGAFDPVDAGSLLAAWKLNDRMYLSTDWSRFRQGGDMRAATRIGGTAHPAGARFTLDSTTWHAMLLHSWIVRPRGYIDAAAGVAGARHELSAASAAAESSETWAYPIPQAGIDAGYLFRPGVTGYLAWVGTPVASDDARGRSGFLRAGVAWRLPMAGSSPESDRADWTLKAGYERNRFSGRDGDARITLRHAGPRLSLAASF